MKINWKILVAMVVIAGILLWGVNSLASQSYSGKTLNFSVGSGSVTITNPSDESVAVQLTGTGSRSFSVVETTLDITGSSKRDGKTQSLEFELPSGISEFSVARGKGVNFISSSDTSLKATVQPLSAGDVQSTLIVVIVVILGALFFISRTTDHLLIKTLRSRISGSTDDTQPEEKIMSGGQGANLRAFGDNRSNAGD